jgi:hypothetical protein
LVYSYYNGWLGFLFNKHLDIADTVTIIEENMYTSKQLTSVLIPDSVTSIGGNAFYRNGLGSIEIPNSVTSIGDKAFANNRLTSITIGSNVALGNDVFCSGFEAAYNNNGMGAGTYKRNNFLSKEWNVWFENFQYQNVNGRITITGYNGSGGNLIIPARINGNPVTVIDEVFRGKNLTSVTIPDSITSIENMTFSGGNWITSITIGSNVGGRSSEYRRYSHNSFDGFMHEVYFRNGRRAGTYTINEDDWSWSFNPR